MIRHTFRLLMAVGAAHFVSGCASYHAMPFVEQGDASTLVEHRERDGLHVAVRDLTQERVTEKHFSRNLLDYGYAPVMLLVEMDSDCRDAFVLRREELQMVLRDGTRLRSVDPQDVVDEVGYSHWRSAFAFMFLIPGPPVVSSVNSANRDLEEDYLNKSLRSVRLSPNMRSFRGVVFFQLPEGSPDLSVEDAFVEITVYKEARKAAETKLGERLEFPVHFSS